MREDIFSLRVRNEPMGAGIFRPSSDVRTECNVRFAEPLKVAPRQVETTSNESSDRFDGFAALGREFVPSLIRPIAAPLSRDPEDSI